MTLTEILAAAGGGATVAEVVRLVFNRGPDLRKELWSRVSQLEIRLTAVEGENLKLVHDKGTMHAQLLLQQHILETQATEIIEFKKERRIFIRRIRVFEALLIKNGIQIPTDEELLELEAHVDIDD